MATEGSGAGQLTAAWRSQSGEILQKTSEFARTGGENTAFSLSQPKGLKPGTYKVVVLLNDDSVDTQGLRREEVSDAPAASARPVPASGQRRQDRHCVTSDCRAREVRYRRTAESYC